MSRTPAEGSSSRTLLALAVVTLAVFGAATTLLGIGVCKLASPCPPGWAVVLVAGPGVITVMGAIVSVVTHVNGGRRPWLPAVLACFLTILDIVAASVAIHVV